MISTSTCWSVGHRGPSGLESRLAQVDDADSVFLYLSNSSVLRENGQKEFSDVTLKFPAQGPPFQVFSAVDPDETERLFLQVENRNKIRLVRWDAAGAPASGRMASSTLLIFARSFFNASARRKFDTGYLDDMRSKFDEQRAVSGFFFCSELFPASVGFSRGRDPPISAARHCADLHRPCLPRVYSRAKRNAPRAPGPEKVGWGGT
jgi:hypothetical protein